MQMWISIIFQSGGCCGCVCVLISITLISSEMLPLHLCECEWVSILSMRSHSKVERADDDYSTKWIVIGINLIPPSFVPRARTLTSSDQMAFESSVFGWRWIVKFNWICVLFDGAHSYFESCATKNYLKCIFRAIFVGTQFAGCFFSFDFLLRGEEAHILIMSMCKIGIFHFQWNRSRREKKNASWRAHQRLHPLRSVLESRRVYNSVVMPCVHCEYANASQMS